MPTVSREQVSSAKYNQNFYLATFLRKQNNIVSHTNNAIDTYQEAFWALNRSYPQKGKRRAPQKGKRRALYLQCKWKWWQLHEPQTCFRENDESESDI